MGLVHKGTEPWRTRPAATVHQRSATPTTIPKIIHHVWPGNDEFPRVRRRLDGASADFHAWRQSWFTHHPDWSFRFWRLEPTGDERMDELLADHRYSVVVKSDVLRWFVLARYGGIYVDTDFECLRPFDDLMQDERGLFLAHEPPIWKHGILSSALIASAPSHPFAIDVFEETLRQLAKTSIERANSYPHIVTGPRMVTEVATGREDFTVHPSWMLYRETPLPDESGATRYAQTWWTGSHTQEGWTHGARFA